MFVMESGRVVEKGNIKERARGANPATSRGGSCSIKDKSDCVFHSVKAKPECTKSLEEGDAQKADWGGTRQRQLALDRASVTL